MAFIIEKAILNISAGGAFQKTAAHLTVRGVWSGGAPFSCPFPKLVLILNHLFDCGQGV